MIGGDPSIEPVVAAASIAFFAGTLLFAWIALGTMWKSSAAVAPRDAAAT